MAERRTSSPARGLRAAQGSEDQIPSLRFTALVREVKQDDRPIIRVPRGSIIKEAGEHFLDCFAVQSGRVNIVRDVQTAKDGKRELVISVAQKGDLLNASSFFHVEETHDVGSRYVAETDAELVVLSTEKFQERFHPNKQAELFIHLLRSAIRKANELREEKLELHREALGEKRELDVEQEIDLLQEVEALHEENQRLCAENQRLREENQRLRAELAPKAVEAFQRLKEDERITRAKGDLMNFAFGLLDRELTDDEAATARRLASEVHPRWMDDNLMRHHPSLRGISIQGGTKSDRPAPVVRVLTPEEERATSKPIAPTVRHPAPPPNSALRPTVPSTRAVRPAFAGLLMKPPPAAPATHAPGPASMAPSTRMEPAIQRSGSTSTSGPNTVRSSAQLQPFKPAITPPKQPATRPGSYSLFGGDMEDEITQVGLGPARLPLSRQPSPVFSQRVAVAEDEEDDHVGRPTLDWTECPPGAPAPQQEAPKQQPAIPILHLDTAPDSDPHRFTNPYLFVPPKE